MAQLHPEPCTLPCIRGADGAGCCGLSHPESLGVRMGPDPIDLHHQMVLVERVPRHSTVLFADPLHRDSHHGYRGQQQWPDP